jgi:hypothetical protein
MSNEQIVAFDAFIKEQAERVDRFDNDEAIVYNIYKPLFKNGEAGEDDQLINIPEDFVDLDIIVHLPAMILTDEGTYYPGEDDYDASIEFFSVMVSK